MSSNRVAIIGAGASGTAVAISILRKNAANELFIFNKSSTCHRGIAYGTKYHEHLLNVPAKKMSIIKEEPLHFFNWVKMNNYSENENAFIPRIIYGKYLEDTFNESQRNSEVKVMSIISEVMNIKPESGKYFVYTETEQLEVDKVILASGWQVGEGIPEEIPDSINSDAKAIIIGTGLTATDSYLTLRKAGLCGEVTMISRRGVLSKIHNLSDPLDTPIKSPDELNLKKLLRYFRERSEERIREGLSWHGVIDAFRPFTKTFWNTLSDREKSRFLRHLRPYWDAHRHRMPEEVGEIIKADLKSGKLKVISGRIVDIKEHGNKEFSVSLRHRHANYTSILNAARLVRADGVTVFSNSKESSIYSSLLNNNLASIDSFSLGFNITKNYELINRDGKISKGIFAIGPLARGTYWETTAVPEISETALQIVTAL